MLDPIVTAAKAGGKVLKKYFGSTLEVREKSGVGNIHTVADIDSEQAILAILEKEFPGYNIFSEEIGMIDRQSQFTFVVDPLDGSNNFIAGIPYFSVSIALMKDKELICGVVYDPIVDRTFHASLEGGAFLGKERLKVSGHDDIHRATVCYACSYETSFARQRRVFNNLGKTGIRRLMTNWSPALDLCLLAAGSVDIVLVEHGTIYDFAAGRLIAQEAGATVTDIGGKKLKSDDVHTFVVSASPVLHKEMTEILNP